ncbi:MAG: FAD-dependent oxidoreductase [Oceanipulchritudo sp.]
MKRRGLPQAVDLLVIGGTGAGVSLALEAAGKGLSVFLTSSRPYLGEDICGDLRLWPQSADRPRGVLSRRVFGTGDRPVTPMTVKRELEQSLVEAGIPFILNAFPARPLRGEEGLVKGCQLATRSGYLEVRTRLVVDATTEGTLARICGYTGRPDWRGRQRVRHVTLCNGEGETAAGADAVTRLEGFEGRIGDRDYALSARLYELDVDFGGGSPAELARAEAEIVDRCWVPGEYLHQERICPAVGRPSGEAATRFEELVRHEGMVLLAPDAYAEPGEREALQEPVSCLEAGPLLLPQIEAIIGTRPLPTGKEVRLPQEEAPLLGRCDVLVLGGGTAGAPAAIAASRQGARVMIVEATDQLGGVGTIGQICRYWCGNRVGFTSEIDASVASLETDARLRTNVGQWSATAKSRWFEHSCHEGGVITFHRSLSPGVLRKGDRITGLEVATPHGFGRIDCGCLVDASGCADVPAAAGAPVVETGASHLAVQGTGLAALEPGRDYHNTDHNFCDDTDVIDTTAFLVSTKLKFPDHFDAGQLVDTRERRQIIGDLQLGPADFLSERRYPDTICVASSNFDSHGFTVHPVFMCQPPDKKRLWADVPFRALLPRGLERVLTTGLGVSAHRDALPVIRMQADVQNQGYAAGCAAARSALTDTDLRNLSMRDLQEHLQEVGILPERCLSEEDSFPVPLEDLEWAATEALETLKGLAMLFANPERSCPILLEALRTATPPRRLSLARVLALMGDASGLAEIRAAVAENGWDEGWNYRGMGQFGMSLSEMDVLLIALGQIGEVADWSLICEKAESLPDDPAFSHCRAVVEASEALHARHPDSSAAVALSRLHRRLPGGAAQTSLTAVQEALTPDPNENGVRNRSLRELHLARGLYRCGDPGGVGRSLLETYARDQRAVFARHAQRVLRESQPVEAP